MTKEQWAENLNGREIGEELSDAESDQANAEGIVVVYGCSDDLTEFRGAIYDEAGAFQGTVHYLAPPKWLLPPHTECGCPFCDYDEVKKTAKAIKATWNNEGYSWTYKTDIPHATFDILEDGKKFCRGIVFEVAALN